MATALEILPLNTVKDSLRLERDEDDLDELLQDQIAAGISLVEQHTGLALVERTETISVAPITDSSTILLKLTSVMVDEDITVTGKDGTSVTVTDFDYGNNRLVLRAPDGGWPTSAESSLLTVTLKRGTAVADVPRGLVHAGVLAVRNIYDGVAEIKPTAAYWSLVRSYVAIV